MFEKASKNFRKKRFELFKDQIKDLPRPVRILDIGGRQSFWETVEFCDEKDAQVTIVNIEEERVTRPNFKSVIGDATDLKDFSDGEFDVAFSNSVIEHVGDFKNQKKLASEVKRVGKRFFLQTPNRFFPLEPHFMLPLFQFWPNSLKVWLITHFAISHYDKFESREAAQEKLDSIQLLSEEDLEELFPEGKIWREKFWGMTKSFVVFGK